MCLSKQASNLKLQKNTATARKVKDDAGESRSAEKVKIICFSFIYTHKELHMRSNNNERH